MEIQHIGSGQATACLMMIAFGVIIPFGSLIVWKIVSKKPVAPFFCGWLVFLLFAAVLEGILSAIILKPTASGDNPITSNPLLYTLYGTLAAGVFEETGRLFAFKVMLKKHNDRQTAITYGLGHGGFEALTVLLVGGISTLITILSINNGTFQQQVDLVAKSDPAQAQTLKAAADVIAKLSVGQVCLSIIERISAITLHVALSMVVFCACRKNKMWLYPVAILLHAVFDIPAALYQAGVLKEMLVVEILLAALAVVMFLFSYCVVYKKWMSDLIDEEPEIIPMNM